LRGQLARRVRRAGTGKPTSETVHGVSSPTQHFDLDKAGAKLLFQIFTEREERRAIAIASNAPFSEWKQTFTDPRLCTAIVDRVTFNAHIVETGTESYRFTQTQRKRRRS
ncbi:ATP-binding protein, partial [Streptomyces bacillaris]|uniref:ATP-binding protein n=1 Tax=Streptomyces bacillaris TaxID=68179 RepID=UPI00368C3DBD